MAKGVKTGGRAAGAQNKVSATVKDNVLAVFNRLDGTTGMAKWAMDNQTQFYQIYAKLLPTEIDQNITGELEITKIERAIVDSTNTDT